MGIPFHSYFGAIVALQLGSLVGVLWLTANQYHIQYQLWQLQSQFEIPGELSVEPKRANRVASGSGDPSGGPSPITGFEANRAPKDSEGGGFRQFFGQFFWASAVDWFGADIARAFGFGISFGSL